MTAIHKNRLEPGTWTVFGTPVSVGLDGVGEPAVWFVNEGPAHYITTIGTGHEFDPETVGRFLGTLVPEPGLVFHAFVKEAA